MSTEETRKRYVGKFFVDEWKHRTGKMCKRVKLTLPSEILDNNNFRLREDRPVLITVEKDGKVTLEPLL